MTKKTIKHLAKEEDYAYASGLLKAREELFISKEELSLFYSFKNTAELLQHLEGKRYLFKDKIEDSLDFENILLKRYLTELSEIVEIIPENYLLNFISLIHSVIYKFDPNVLKSGSTANFKDNLKELTFISQAGTDYTKKISSHIVDKFNISEQFRALLNKEKCEIYYESGNISKESLETLFSSYFSNIPPQVENSLFKEFFLKNSPVKEINFNLIFSFENYWINLLESLAEEKKEEPYGLNYVISYFLRFLLEILNLKRVFVLLQYDVKTFIGESL
jgi:vacuolar-type H+-ATPase subunit C/Vma6